MLSAATMKFYRGLWAQLRKARGLKESDRKPLHAQLGLPASSKDFTKEHFDEWKRHVLAETRPANVTAQIEQMAMPQTRRLVFIGHLLAALEHGEEYGEDLVVRLREKESFMRRRDNRMGGRMVTLRGLSLRGLDAVRNALKDECRARWKTKEELLGEVLSVRAHCDPFLACQAVMQALNTEAAPTLSDLCYEDLLVSLSAMRHLADGSPWLFVEHGEHAATAVAADNRPF